MTMKTIKNLTGDLTPSRHTSQTNLCRICQGEDEYDRRVTFEFVGDINDPIDSSLLLECLKHGETIGYGYFDRHPNEIERTKK